MTHTAPAQHFKQISAQNNNYTIKQGFFILIPGGTARARTESAAIDHSVLQNNMHFTF